MSDGPFREPQEPPVDKTRLGGGLPRPDSLQDPYFRPPVRPPNQPNPQLPPADAPVKNQPNPQRPPADAPVKNQPEPQRPPADARPQNPVADLPKVDIVPVAPLTLSVSELDQLLEARKNELNKARARQAGAPLANALIGGTSGAFLTEPISKGLTKLSDRALQTSDPSKMYRGMRGVAEFWSMNFNPAAIKAADESVISSTFAKIDQAYSLDQKVLERLMIKKTRLVPLEEAHLESLKTSLGVTKTSDVRQILTHRVNLLNPQRIGGMNAEQMGGVVNELAKGKLVSDAEYRLLTSGTDALKAGDSKELISSTFRQIGEMHDLDRKVLDKLIRQKNAVLLPAEEAHLASLKTGLNVLENSEIKKVLTHRQALLKTERLAGMNADQMGTLIKELEISRLSKGKLVTDAEFQNLLLRRKALESYAESSKLGAAGEGWLTTGGAMRNAKTAFFSTLGAGTLLKSDEYVRDYLYNGELKSWESQSLTVPVAIAAGKAFRSKSALAVAAAVSGHLLDKQLPAPGWVPDAFKSFSAWDAAALGIAFAMPAKGRIAKTGLVTLAWAVGNGLEATCSPPSAGDIEENALSCVKNDGVKRTSESMDEAVQKFKELGTKNEIILEQNFAQVLVNSQRNYGQMNQEGKLLEHRKFLVVGRALAEHRLESGSRLAVLQTEKPTYILKGHNLDFGGEALSFLMLTKKSVEASSALTKSLVKNNGTVGGTAVTEGELRAIETQGGKIDADIAKINGKHDIAGAFSEMQAFLKRGTTSTSASFNPLPIFQKTAIDDINNKLVRWSPGLRNQDGTENEEVKMVVAKLFRDQALAKLALCAYSIDGNNLQDAAAHLFGTDQGRSEILPGSKIKKSYDGVLDMLECAEALGPKNQDLPELKAIAKALVERLKKASNK